MTHTYIAPICPCALEGMFYGAIGAAVIIFIMAWVMAATRHHRVRQRQWGRLKGVTMSDFTWRERETGFFLYRKDQDFGALGNTFVPSLGPWQKMGAHGNGISATATDPFGKEHVRDGFWNHDEAMAWVERVVNGVERAA